MKSLLRRGLEGAFERRGYSLIPTWKREEWEQQAAMQTTLPEHLKHLMGRLGCDCVFDVGANRGQFRDMLRQEAGFAGSIVSYEPLPELANLLAERARSDPLWQVEAAALGERAGEVDFNVMARDVFSSFLEPVSSQPRLFKDSNAVVRRVRVPVRTLEQELRRLAEPKGFRRIFLKLDTQGYDLGVLRGAGDGLSRVVALQSEVSLVPLYEGMTDWLAAIGEYRRRGFEVTAMRPVSVDPATCRVVEFDCVLVRPDAVGAESDGPGESRTS